MTLRPIVLTLLLTAPMAAQTSIETGGGVGRLDRHARGAFQSFRAQLLQRVGPARLTLQNTTAEHRGLGTFSHTALDLQTSLATRDWEVTLGPVARIARGVDQPSARTLGASLAVRHPMGGMEVIGRYQFGSAWYASDRASWRQIDLRTHASRGVFRIGSTLRHAVVHEQVMPLTGPILRDLESMNPTATGPRTVQRVGFSLGMQYGVLTIDGQAGRQFMTDMVTRDWWEANVQLQMSSALAVVFNSSLATGDPVLRMQGGRFASIGLRLGRTATEKRVRPDPLAVEVSPHPNGWRVRFAIPGARHEARLYGDLTGWEPIELVRLDDGRWEAILTARPGMYRINVASDNGDWQVPPGLAAFADEFGTQVGLLRIPDR